MRGLVTLIAAGLIFAQASRTTWDGVYTEAQAKRGATLYSDNCAACHGTDLTGGESAPPLAGIPFFATWNGLTVGDLFERIRTSMPADRPGRLSREQNADILSHVLKVNGFPAGPTELSRQTETLKEIQLVTYKPDERK